MRSILLAVIVAGVLASAARAQETKPVPKNSIRVYVPGCSKGQIFTAARPTEDRPGGSAVPDGAHLRMNGPKKLIAEIKDQEGTLIEITGLMRRGQFEPGGVRIGPGVRISPGAPSSAGGMMPSPALDQAMIDVEGWRQIPGECPSR